MGKSLIISRHYCFLLAQYRYLFLVSRKWSNQESYTIIYTSIESRKLRFTTNNIYISTKFISFFQGMSWQWTWCSGSWQSSRNISNPYRCFCSCNSPFIHWMFHKVTSQSLFLAWSLYFYSDTTWKVWEKAKKLLYQEYQEWRICFHNPSVNKKIQIYHVKIVKPHSKYVERNIDTIFTGLILLFWRTHQPPTHP